ncbi:MAG: ABC transporter permease [Candidatus Zixiibacteriota bacterium]
MFKHNIKSILRNLLKHKSSSIINIVGMAIGIGCCLLVTLWISGEYNYDNFHEHLKDIYKVFSEGENRRNPSMPAPLGPVLEEQYPEIEYASRFESFSTLLFVYRDKKFYENNIWAADNSFFRIFSFEFVAGNAASAFADMYSLVITEATAKRYFGNEDPLGKVLNKDGAVPFTVSAVVKNHPVNSSFNFDMLVPFEYRILFAKQTTGWDMGWGWFSPSIYVRLRDNCKPAEVERKISSFFSRQMENEKDGLRLMPFKEYHFYDAGTKQYTYIFSTIALLVLAMACINFVNLSTARFSDRAREVSVRKVSGAPARQLYFMFLGESIAVSLAAVTLGMVFAELTIPLIQSSTGFNIYLGITDIPYFLPVLTLAAVLIGVIAGAYPAFYLSSISPKAVVERSLKYGEKGLNLRRILVVIQFSCSVFLIMGTIIIFKQSAYIDNKDMGYAKEQIINIPLRGETVKSYPVLKSELNKNLYIAGVSGSAASFPFWQWTTGAVSWDEKNPDEEIQVGMNYVDYGFIETMGIEMVEGRSFSEEYPSDLTSGFLINQEMAKLIGPDSPVGKNLKYIEQPGQIVGVMKNFHWEPLHREVRPLIFALVPEQVMMMSVRVLPGNFSTVLDSLEIVWERIVSGYPFEFHSITQSIRQRYRSIDRLGNMSGGLAFIAVFIACLGLIGLTSFIVTKRKKEISIRKVLGASTWNIVGLLSKEYVLLLLVACLLTFPPAYLLLRSWLSDFAYHTNIMKFDFLLSGLLVLVTVLLSVAAQAVKAATSNPVNSLRSE